MPGFFVHLNAPLQCTHAARAQVAPTQARVLVNGLAVALITDKIAVTGCPFTLPNGKPQPCVQVTWLLPSTRVFINGQAAMVAPSPGAGPGLCQSVEQIPQGPPVVGPVQNRVFAM